MTLPDLHAETAADPAPPDDLFALAFEASSIGMAIVSLDGHWLKVNRALCEILGYHEEELASRTFQSVTHPDDLAPDLALTSELLRGERRSYQLEKRYRHRSGAYIWTILSVSLARDGAGAPRHFLSQVQDISELKRAQSERERFFGLSLDLMAVAGLDGYFRQVNPAWSRVLGWSEEELLASPTIEFVHPDDREVTLAARAELASGQPLRRLENRYRCKDGSYRWLSWRCVALPEMGVVYAVARDTTDRRNAEEALRRARESAEAASRAKSEFLAMMSHEIRTPMNAVLGFGELLQGTNLDPQQADFVAQIQQSGATLLEIINGILDFSKMEAGMYRFASGPTNPVAIARQVHDMLAPLAEARALRFSLEIDPAIPECLETDAGALKRVLTNLVGNAIKFTEVGSVVLAMDRVEDNVRPILRVEVRDTGIGFPEGAAERLFEPFAQEDQSDRRRFGGTGLGLSISRHLARGMGGELVARRRGDSPGAVFTLTLPLVAGDAPGTPDDAEPVTAVPEDLRILLVEDNPTNQRLTRLLLKRLGLTCDVAGNGRLALEACERCDYDVILMDVQMPEMDGWDATREIRRREGARADRRRAVIIGHTAYASEDETRKCLAVGMDAHLAKPITLPRLAAALARVALPAGEA